MHIESGHNDYLDQLNQASKKLAQEFLQYLKPEGEPIDVVEVASLYKEECNQGRFFQITDGSVGYKQQDKILFYYDTGDIIGVEQQYDPNNSILFSDVFMQLQAYRIEDLERLINENPEAAQLWQRYLLSQHTVLAAMIGLNSDEPNTAALGFQRYSSGDVIIQEGEPASEVYAIVEGHADVYINDTKVGEVLEEEIFGAMAVFTRTTRTASVIATKPCMVLVVPRDQFMTLMKTHPRICMNLIENMARQIISLNERILTLEPPETDSTPSTAEF